jgi:hypothetical protein
MNPKAYEVPPAIRDFFEHVTSTKDGEYKETRDQPLFHRKSGYTGHEDFTHLVDGKGNAILCVQCGKAAFGNRPLVPCSVCGVYWHLDCTDPPRGRAPVPVNNEYYWVCPRHVSHDMARPDPSYQWATSTRLHRIRKPKRPVSRRTYLTRGLRNNGNIEIESESEASSIEEVSVMGDIESDDDGEGVVYHIPAKGIKLDFIEKARE